MSILNTGILTNKISDTLLDLEQTDIERGEKLADSFSSWFITVVNPPITNRSKTLYKSPIVPILSAKIESLDQFEDMIQRSLDIMAKIVLIDPSVLSAISTGVVVNLPTRKINLESAIAAGMRNGPNAVQEVSYEIALQAVLWGTSGSVAPAGSPTGVPWA